MAAPPSMRCEACQLRLVQDDPMSLDDVNLVRGSFNHLLATMSGKAREDIAQRLDRLCSKLQGGQIARPVQSNLMCIAELIATGDNLKATQVLASISAEHWNLHKDWIVGVRRLLREK